MKSSSRGSILACLLASAILVVAVSCNRPPDANQSKSAQDAEVAHRVSDELNRQRQAETDRLAVERLEAERKAQADREVEARVQARLAEERQRAAAQEPAPAPAAAPTSTPTSRIASVEETLDDEDDALDAPVRPTGAALDPKAYRLFYEKLSRNGGGDWLETQNYGFVFQPRAAAADPSWRPYTDGYWARTEAGWTWVSQEPFGWATYHYGRWARLQGVGWVWTPGTTWAPAYVSWRVSADKRLVGWSPLPPEARVTAQRRREGGEGFGRWVDRTYDIGPENYSFIPASEFGDTTYRQHVLPQSQNISIVEQSENVTRITYRQTDNRTVIVNDGPDIAVLRQESRQPMRELRLERRDEPASFFLGQPAAAGPGGITQVQGDRLIVATAAATEIASAAIQAIRPPDIKRKVEAAPVDRGYGGMRDPQAIERVRGKIRAEGPPPPPEVERRAAAAQRENRPALAAAAAAPSAAPAVSAPARIQPAKTPVPVAPIQPPRTEEERAARRAARQAERAQSPQEPALIPAAPKPASSPAAAPAPLPAASPITVPSPSQPIKTEAEKEAARLQRRAEREKAQPPPASTLTPANLPSPAAQPLKTDAEREANRAQRRAEREKAQPQPSPAPSATNAVPPATQPPVKPVETEAQKEVARAQRNAERAKAKSPQPAAPPAANPPSPTGPTPPQ